MLTLKFVPVRPNAPGLAPARVRRSDSAPDLPRAASFSRLLGGPLTSGVAFTPPLQPLHRSHLRERFGEAPLTAVVGGAVARRRHACRGGAAQWPPGYAAAPRQSSCPLPHSRGGQEPKPPNHFEDPC